MPVQRSLPLAALLALLLVGPASAQTVGVSVVMSAAVPIYAVLKYGTTPAYELGALPSPFGTAHAWTITDLLPDTTYYFQYIPSNGAGSPQPPVEWGYRTPGGA